LPSLSVAPAAEVNELGRRSVVISDRRGRQRLRMRPARPGDRAGRLPVTAGVGRAGYVSRAT
jgi:hypothetical protein